MPETIPSEQTSLSWVVEAARAAAAKTDESTVVLDVGEVLSITGWFVVTRTGEFCCNCTPRTPSEPAGP